MSHFKQFRTFQKQSDKNSLKVLKLKIEIYSNGKSISKKDKVVNILFDC